MLGLTCIFIFLPGTSYAEIKLPGIFGNNMVLQQDINVPVWGYAKAGEKITVIFNGNRISGKADNNGDWKVVLPPMKAGGPFEMVIEGKNSIITFKNILVGEVWLCSGQSNMEWPVNQSDNAEEEIDKANFPEIRIFTVPRKMGVAPLNDLEAGEWLVCTPENIGSFSAVGYYFGRNIHTKLNQPVGLINSSWGGTVVETWTSAETMKNTKDFKQLMAKSNEFDLEKSIRDAEMLYKQWIEKLDVEDEGIINKWHLPVATSDTWETMELPVLWESAGLPNLDGVVWFRKEIVLTPDMIKHEMTLNLGPVDDSDFTYVNGQLVGSIKDQYSQNRRYQVSPEHLNEGVNIIAVRVIDTGGGGGIWGSKEQLYYEIDGKRTSLAGEWDYKIGISSNPPARPDFNPNRYPSLLFNGMINPLIPYAMQGVIWYQGESNDSRAYQYRELFPNLINDWRTLWNQGEFPFLFVQLANYRPAHQKPMESDWAELREAQAMTLSLPNTGMAATIDIGEADDIHPGNKQDVGLRLALAALKIAYGMDIVFSGPMFSSFNIDGNKITLHFDHTGSGLKTAGDQNILKGFAIAGEDRKFKWANARIEGSTVIVFNETIEKPVAVRYAWADNPGDANLYNNEGLPAVPFRTDDWPGITYGVK